jgi:hypothetical protein
MDPALIELANASRESVHEKYNASSCINLRPQQCELLKAGAGSPQASTWMRQNPRSSGLLA